MADEKEEGKSEETKAPKKSLLGVLFAVVNLAVMGGATFAIFKLTIGYEPPKMYESEAIEEVLAERETKGAEAVMYLMDPFAVNLKGTPQRQLNIEMYVEMLDGEGYEEVVDMSAETRDIIMKTMASKTFVEIESVQGKLFLKEQLATKINGFLNRGIVKDIFFSRFMIE